MKEIFNLSGIKKLVLAVAVLIGLNAFTSAGAGTYFSKILGFATTPLLKLTASAAGKVTQYVDLDSMTKEELKQKNQQLSEENAQLRDQLLDFYKTEQENTQLREQLKITTQRPDVVMVAASVIARSSSDVFASFSIDRGSMDGVSVGDAVITPEGLVGITTDVYVTSSTVKTIFSEDVKVSVISQYYNESGVAGSTSMLASNGLLSMDYLSNDTKIKPDAIISTSGAGGVYPENLVVGYVTSIEQSKYAVSKYAVIQPYADIKNVKDVFVITNFPGKNETSALPAENSGAQADPEAE